MNMEIRKANEFDISKLKTFFIKAYGENTIFQDEKFLLYYFNLKNESQSLIAVTSSGEIVSHYGGLQYEILLNKKVCKIVWGVNAFTLQEYRGKGINNLIVEYILKHNQLNAVIGFTKKTGSFYEKLNYNLFEYNRFKRYILILDYAKTLEIKKIVNSKLGELPNNKFNTVHLLNINNIVELNKQSINNYSICLHNTINIKATTNRTKEFLKKRFFDYPYTKYQLYGYVVENKVIAYIAFKIEKLVPVNYNYFKIIDIYGDENAVGILLDKAKNLASQYNCIYIDFAMFGINYHSSLIDKGFSCYKDDEYSVLPFLSNPIENRENREFVGIQANSEINVSQFSYQDVFFTRLDSDRDRIANIKQIE